MPSDRPPSVAEAYPLGVAPSPGRRVAVVGAGIAGLLAAYLMGRRHAVTLFEAAAQPGGHVHTVAVDRGSSTVQVDTGFIVFNRPNYPTFTRLLDQLGVPSDESDMSFGVRCERTGLEYRGSGPNTLFAQRRNLLRPRFWRMLADILRFGREARALLAAPEDERTLGDWLASRGLRGPVVEHYVVPMSAALWSAEPRTVLDIPAWWFARFFENHGFFRLRGRPPWLVVRGGSRRYVDALLEAFRGTLHVGTPVTHVRRAPEGVWIEAGGAAAERYDDVVLALHADQALRVLADPSDRERDVLGALRFQANEAILHQDPSVMPRSHRAWSSWNVHLGVGSETRATVTYHMNRLQGLPGDPAYFVTLNRAEAIDPARILHRIVYHHPVMDLPGRRARGRKAEIQGQRRTWYCGAYWGWGFHEDGARSAAEVGRAFGVEL